MAKLKKMGMAGGFGARYGATIRKRWNEQTKLLRGVNKCPKCKTPQRNMRQFFGVWKCRKCGAEFTGGTWRMITARGKESQRIVTRINAESQTTQQ